MIVGENPRGEDMAVNVCKKKQLTNMRASGSDDALRLIPPRQMSIERLSSSSPTMSCSRSPRRASVCASAFCPTPSV